MELRHLEHFLAVAEEQSFTRAAARIHLVQSALSVSIRSLEQELGGRLFDRTTHRVELTDAGQALVIEARRTLAAAEAARDAVAAVLGGLRGTVRIGIMHSLSLIDLAALLTTYHRERPQVQLVPVAALGGSAELVRDVADGKLDLAFAALPSGYPAGVTVLPLASEEMMLVCPQDHPLAERSIVSLAELDGQRFVESPPGWGTRRATDRLFLDEGLRREIVVEVDDFSNMINLLRAGFGFAILSPSTIADTRGLALRPIQPSADFTVSLITATERPLSAAARVMVDLIVSTYCAEAPAGQ